MKAIVLKDRRLHTGTIIDVYWSPSLVAKFSDIIRGSMDTLKIGENDPLPLRIIERRKASAPERCIRYIRRGHDVGRISSVRRAASRSTFPSIQPPEPLPGYFTMLVVRDGSYGTFGETLTTGEANTQLKIVPTSDGWFQVELL